MQYELTRLSDDAVKAVQRQHSDESLRLIRTTSWLHKAEYFIAPHFAAAHASVDPYHANSRQVSVTATETRFEAACGYRKWKDDP